LKSDVRKRCEGLGNERRVREENQERMYIPVLLMCENGVEAHWELSRKLYVTR
jgi:hypothetical protein